MPTNNKIERQCKRQINQNKKIPTAKAQYLTLKAHYNKGKKPSDKNKNKEIHLHLSKKQMRAVHNEITSRQKEKNGRS